METFSILFIICCCLCCFLTSIGLGALLFKQSTEKNKKISDINVVD